MNAIAHRLTQLTMLAALVAAGIAVQPAHAAPVRVVQLPNVVVIAKRIPVVQLERVVVTAKRLVPAPTVLAQRDRRATASATGRV